VIGAGNRTIARSGVLDGPGEFLVVVLLVLAAVVLAGIWVTGQVAGLLFRGEWPPVAIAQSLAIAGRLPARLADPRLAWPVRARASLPGPGDFAASAMITVMTMTATAAFGVRRVAARRGRRGFASRRQIRTRLSERAVVRRAAVIRPSLGGRHCSVTHVGVRAGREVRTGMPLAISGDSSVLLLAAPRIGKTSQVVIPWLASWPGPALVTSVRADVLENTALLRARVGPVLVMAPTGMIAWPQMLRWSPASGCGSFDQARQRADVMVTVGKQGKDASDSGNAAYFGMMATNLLAGWLHAAAISGRGMDDVLTWALDERQDEPVKILRDHPDAAPGTAGMLDAAYRSPEVTRSNLWTTVQTAIAPLLASAARATFAPPPGDSADLAGLLRRNATIYLLASERQSAVIAPLVTAFFDELADQAKQLADASPAGRLDPPLGLILDEAANVVPLPSLPALMSYAGGSGIFTLTVLQNRAQAEHRWGREGAAMLWGAANVKIALGGLSGEELKDLSALAGEYREALTTTQRGSGGQTLQTTLTDRKVITPDEIRTLSERDRQALIIHATTPAVRARMARHYESPDRDRYAAARDHARRIIAAAGQVAAGDSQPGAGL
jgi:type IV secretion system protein VirD4